MKILALIPESHKNSPARIYCGEGMLERLKGKHPVLPFVEDYGTRKYNDIDVDYVTRAHYEMDWAALMRVASEYDWLFVMKSAEPHHAQIASELRSFGLKLWYSLDDDYTAVGYDNVAYKTFQRPEVRNSFEWFLNNADLLTFSTLELYNKFGANRQCRAEVCPNALDDKTFNLNEQYPAPEKKLITWRGGGTHAKDLMFYQAQLSEFITDNPKWEFRFVGIDHQFADLVLPYANNPNVKLQGYIPSYWHYMGYLAQSKPWGHIVPLVDNAFNRAKSSISALEAVYAGAVPVVPKWVEWEMPSVLSYDSPSEFLGQMRVLIAMEKREHEDRWIQNMEWIKKNRALSVVNEKRANLLRGTK